MDVDPVEQRAGSVILIFGDHSHRTGARFDGIVMVAAGTGIYGCDQIKGNKL